MVYSRAAVKKAMKRQEVLLRANWISVDPRSDRALSMSSKPLRLPLTVRSRLD